MKWRKPPRDLLPDQDFVDVWRSEIDLPENEVSHYQAMLSSEELQRAERFKFASKRREYIVTRGLLRSALGLLMKVGGEEIGFSYTAENKPVLENVPQQEQLVFNASHSHGQAVVAVSLNRQLGVDIEKIRNDVEYEKLATRYFSENEQQALKDYQGDRREAFFATWTRKEAFVKAVGKGIAYGLSEFDVNVDPKLEPVMLATRWQVDDAHNWFMAKLPTARDYQACVAADGGEFSLRLWQFA